VISPTQRPLADNTQRSQETNIHVPGGIRTRNPSKRAAAYRRRRPRGHWDRRQNPRIITLITSALINVEPQCTRKVSDRLLCRVCLRVRVRPHLRCLSAYMVGRHCTRTVARTVRVQCFVSTPKRGMSSQSSRVVE
jgi:hypothetical protein